MHASLVYYNSCLFMFGGYTNESAPSDELWCFDLNLRQWSLKQLVYYAPNQPQHISYAPLSTACNVRYIFLCRADRSLRPRYFHTACAFASSMYIFGGKVDGKPSVRLGTLEPGWVVMTLQNEMWSIGLHMNNHYCQRFSGARYDVRVRSASARADRCVETTGGVVVVSSVRLRGGALCACRGPPVRCAQGQGDQAE